MTSCSHFIFNIHINLTAVMVGGEVVGMIFEYDISLL
jgi:hypothetical protein